MLKPDYIGNGAGVSSVNLNTNNVFPILPNDQYWNRQWGLLNDGSFDSQSQLDADVDMELAWNIETGSF